MSPEKPKMKLKKRSVVFNVEDADQKALYDHSKLYTNFSAYVKWLISRDMSGEFDSK